MASRVVTALAKRVLLKSLGSCRSGFLEIVCSEATYQFGNPEDSLRATLVVKDDQFFYSVLFGGDIGVGESYTRGDWSTPDLVALMRFGCRAIDQLEKGSRIAGFFRRLSEIRVHRYRRNTLSGSRKNIAYHYDLGNEFYRLFLDSYMAYSCAFYKTSEDSLESAQLRKFDRICRKLLIGPKDHVLEIGTGWGGFAAYAAKNYGCRVTTTTISRRQYDYSRELVAREGLNRQINLLCDDYRSLVGQYDKIVSVEMFEAVGYEHYDDYFRACGRLLSPDGSMFLQAITIQEAKFEQYRRQSDWIRKYIFPGAELASVGGIIASLKRMGDLQLFHLEDIGMHYALTLREWRRRFLNAQAEIEKIGFGPEFCRMWEYYLAYCEGAFLERYISDVQIVITKTRNARPLINEPCKKLTKIKHADHNDCARETFSAAARLHTSDGKQQAKRSVEGRKLSA
jgi:cyclopropane-fatty-acyl-phospholipid synthase